MNRSIDRIKINSTQFKVIHYTQNRTRSKPVSMRAPPSSPVRATGEEAEGAASEVGTTGPTTAAAAPEEAELLEARQEGEVEALALLVAPDESGILASSVRAGELFTRSACAWALGAVVLAAYWAKLPPGLAAADQAGKFVATACGGLRGPTDGQRLPALSLLLTAVAVRLVPCGSPAWRANMLSAFYTSATSALLFLCIEMVGRANTRRRFFLRHGVIGAGGTEGTVGAMAAAAAAALFFAWSPRTWEHATKPGGEAFNTLLAVVALFAALQVASTWDRRARQLWGRVGACIAGLALSNQPSMAAAWTALLVHGPLLASSIAGVARDMSLVHVLIDLGAVFGLSLLPGVVMPLASIFGKGQPGPTYTEGAAAVESWSDAVRRLAALAGEMALHQGLYGVGPLLQLLGLGVSLRWRVGRYLLPARYVGDAAKVQAALNRNIQTILRQLPDAHGRQQREEMDQRERAARLASARVVWAILWAFTLTFLAAAVTQHRDVDVAVTHLLLGCFWVGVGVGWGLQQLVSAVPPPAQMQVRNAARRWLRYLGACVLCIGPPLLQLLRTQTSGSIGELCGGVDLWYRYSSSLLEPLPHKAVLLVGDIQLSALRYHQACQGMRSDVTVLPLPRNGSIDALIDRAPVYLAGCVGQGANNGDSIMTVPFGLTMRFLRRDAPEAEQQWYEANKRAWRAVLHEGALPLTALPPSQPITRDVFEHLAESASHMLDDVVLTDRASFARLAEAAWWFEVVVALDPGRAARVDRNLGLAYSHMIKLETPSTASQTLLRLGSGENDLFRDVARNVTRWYDPWRPGADDWRTWAGERLLEVWRAYLDRADAAREPGVDKIRHLYELARAELGAAK